MVTNQLADYILRFTVAKTPYYTEYNSKGVNYGFLKLASLAR